MSESKNPNELIIKIDDYLRSNREVLTWMKSLIKQMKKHQLAVQVSKTVGGAVGLVSFPFYFFPPLIPVGIGLSAVAGVTSGGAAVGDIVKTSLSNKEIQEKLKYLQESSKRLEELEKATQEEATTLSKESGISEDEAYFSICQGVINSKYITGSMINLDIKTNINSSSDENTRNGPTTLSKVGKSAALGARGAVGLFGYVAPFVDEAVTAGAMGGAVTGAGIAARVIGITAAGIGAAIGIGDAIYSWLSTNASLKEASELETELNNGFKTMEELKVFYENMKKSPVNNMSVVIGGDLVQMSKQLIPAGQCGGPGKDDAGTSDDLMDDNKNNHYNRFDGLQQFKNGNSLYEILLKWLEGMLKKLLNSNFTLCPLTNEFNPEEEPELPQFAFTQFLQYTMSTNTQMTVPFVPRIARPTSGRHKAVMYSEEHLLADNGIPLTFDFNQNGTKVTIIYTQNLTLQAQTGRKSTWLERVTQFAQQNPDTACFVMYRQPCPRSEVCWLWLDQIGNDHLPMNIAFIEVDFTISLDQKNISNLIMKLKNCSRMVVNI
ncbi:unnamed protein product [Meganyctiphanes norvegica]|uniref:Uncharacterized protein n=1 Tax=Meganyctiphanes norvegica TaxID=48144 RepID=A0AAV2SL86_MEGNR